MNSEKNNKKELLTKTGWNILRTTGDILGYSMIMTAREKF